MSKKEIKDTAKAAEKQEQERRKVIADFNMNNMGKMVIDPDKVPTDADIENAKKEFEEFTKTLQEKNDYLVADAPNALRVAKFMQGFIDRNVWTGRAFVGVLNFHALMEDFIKGLDESNPFAIKLEYGAMQFADLMFENFGGVGIDSAEWIAENWEEYIPIYEKLHELNDWHELQVKKSENLRQKGAAMAQGYYLEVIEGSDDDTVDPATVEDHNQTEGEKPAE